MSQTQTIIDVREPDEYAAGHHQDAINIPLSTLPGNPKLNNIAKDSKIILYCRSGSRSGMAQQILSGQGYTSLTNGINQNNVEKQFG
ncbi:rhodanese-like domain-containing protein [Candidatus Saccharibacteria bacterium]|nr:rhodanese-like domain-containing protein [Candidatus Saccharibacteria bacterium]